uniref:Uncharacterized protein n=1 Tax=Haemonchus contortus TaxID=6289 RepID=A0A7I4YYK1_HAECO
MMPSPLISRRDLLWFSMLATCFTLTGTVYCYTDNFKEKVITKKEHRFCTGSYDYKRIAFGNYSLSDISFWYADVDSKLPVFCEIFDSTPSHIPQIISGKDKEMEIGSSKKGRATCYCNTSIICATQRDTFKDYISKAGANEKSLLQKFLKTDSSEAEEELRKFMATSLAIATTGSINSSKHEGLNQEAAANAASDESYNDSRSSPNLLLILGVGAVVVLIIIAIIALVPTLIKYRQKRRKGSTNKEGRRGTGKRKERKRNEGRKK